MRKGINRVGTVSSTAVAFYLERRFEGPVFALYSLMVLSRTLKVI